MSCLRLLWFILIAGSVWLLTGFLTYPFSPASPDRSHTPAGPDPPADRILAQALERLDPQRIAWLETRLWQQVNLDGLAYQAEGRYLAGPEHRLRLELTTRQGSTEGTLWVICDGATLWQARRIGNSNWTGISRIDWREVRQALDHPEIPPRARDEFLQDLSFGGPCTLLRGLQRGVTWSRSGLVRRNGHELIKLTGEWTAGAAPLLLTRIPIRRDTEAMPALPGQAQPLATSPGVVGNEPGPRERSLAGAAGVPRPRAERSAAA